MRKSVVDWWKNFASLRNAPCISSEFSVKRMMLGIFVLLVVAVCLHFCFLHWKASVVVVLVSDSNWMIELHNSRPWVSWCMVILSEFKGKWDVTSAATNLSKTQRIHQIQQQQTFRFNCDKNAMKRNVLSNVMCRIFGSLLFLAITYTCIACVS